MNASKSNVALNDTRVTLATSPREWRAELGPTRDRPRGPNQKTTLITAQIGTYASIEVPHQPAIHSHLDSCLGAWSIIVDVTDPPLQTIGEFARSTRLTVKALRINRLEEHLAALEQQHSGRRLLIRHIHAIIRQEAPPMFETQTRHVPATRVMSIQRRLHAHETDAFVAEAKAAFAQHLAGRTPTGPFTLTFHGIVDSDSDGPIEATLPCADDLTPTEVIGIRTEPAHDEVYTAITKAEWEYPAILAAYDAVACCPQALARPGSRLSCREVYHAEPDDIGDHQLICDIAFPLGEI